METSVMSLPDEMIMHLSTFLNHKSLIKFSELSRKIRRSVLPVVSAKSCYVVDRDFMCFNILPSKFITTVIHGYIKTEWKRFYYPLTAYAKSIELRGQSAKIVQSVHVEHFDIIQADMHEFLNLLGGLKLLSFGKLTHPVNHLKTVALQTNTVLGEAAVELKNIQRIIVRSFGPPSLEFKETLRTLIAGNWKSLVELDIQSSFEDHLFIDLDENLRLRALKTNVTMSSLLPNMPNFLHLQELECRVIHEDPFYRSSPNLRFIKLIISVESWQSDDLRNYYPNLTSIAIRSSYPQFPRFDENKVTMNHVTSMTGMYFGVVILGNYIAPELKEVDISPLSRHFNNHVSKYSKKLEVFRGKDNLLQQGKRETIKQILILNPNLREAIMTHNGLTCTCDLLHFAADLSRFLAVYETKCQIEFYFESDKAYQQRTLEIFEAMSNFQVLWGGDQAQIIMRPNARIVLKFITTNNRERHDF